MRQFRQLSTLDKGTISFSTGGSAEGWGEDNILIQDKFHEQPSKNSDALIFKWKMRKKCRVGENKVWELNRTGEANNCQII